jgi:hypothetical protein
MRERAAEAGPACRDWRLAQAVKCKVFAEFPLHKMVS